MIRLVIDVNQNQPRGPDWAITRTALHAGFGPITLLEFSHVGTVTNAVTVPVPFTNIVPDRTQISVNEPQLILLVYKNRVL